MFALSLSLADGEFDPQCFGVGSARYGHPGTRGMGPGGAERRHVGHGEAARCAPWPPPGNYAGGEHGLPLWYLRHLSVTLLLVQRYRRTGLEVTTDGQFICLPDVETQLGDQVKCVEGHATMSQFAGQRVFRTSKEGRLCTPASTSSFAQKFLFCLEEFFLGVSTPT